MKRSIALPLVILGVVLAFNLIFTPGFFSIEMRDGRLFGSLVDICNRAVPVLLLSLGMSLVIATGGVDLSVGAVMAIAGATAACLIARPDSCILNSIHVVGTLPIVLFALIVAAICGVFNGALVSFIRIQPIVATLLLMVAGRGAAQLLTNGQVVTFEDAPFHALGSGAILGLPNPIWIFSFVAILVALLVRATSFGLYLAATGINRTAATIVGIDSRRTIIAAYMICAVLAGLAGVIGAADIKAADANNAGLYLELDAILAVAIGGTSMSGGKFSLLGSIIGAILMQALTTTILTRGVAQEATLIIKAIVVVAVCILASPTVRPKWRVAA